MTTIFTKPQFKKGKKFKKRGTERKLQIKEQCGQKEGWGTWANKKN